MKGIIEKKEVKETDDWKRAAFMIEGKRYSTFDEAIIDSCSKGDYVEFEAVQKEKNGMTFNNLTSMKKLDEQPESVKLDYPNARWDKPKNGNGSMYAAYAKDIFCILEGEPLGERMQQAIDLVKQAKEAFE